MVVIQTPNTYKQYMKQIEEYSKLFPNKKVKIYNCGAEDLLIMNYQI